VKYWTLAEIRSKIEAECDLEDEDFIRSNELRDYVNEAIDEAESEIHSLYEDYFLKKEEVTVSSGDEELDLPTDIYAHKLRRLIFREGLAPESTTVYTIDRIKDWKKFEDKAVYDTQLTTDLYRYFLINETPGSPKIMLTPKVRESGVVTIWYLRNANRLDLETDICDIPEFANFIFSHVKVKVYEKEGHPGLAHANDKLEKERMRMVSTLSQMVPDAANELEMDTSHYEEMT
jgi:hypothetical protein